MAQLYGVDISEFQGAVDWDALNAASNFVMIRASFGTARKDFQFDRNQAEARRVRDQAGPLGIGYYYFAYPTLLAPQESADFFVDNLGGLQAGEVLVLDLEGNIGSNPVGWSLDFLRRVEQRTGVKPLIYLNQSIMTGFDWSSVVNGGFGLWVADYDSNKTSVPPMGQWPVVAMKQWTDVDIVNGVPVKVDGDTFFGDFATFAAYGLQPPAPAALPAAAAPVEPPAPAHQIPVTVLPEPAPSSAPDPAPSVSVVPPAPAKIDSISALPPQVSPSNATPVPVNKLEAQAYHWVTTAVGQLGLGLTATVLTSLGTWLVTQHPANGVAAAAVGMAVNAIHMLLNLSNKNIPDL